MQKYLCKNISTSNSHKIRHFNYVMSVIGLTLALFGKAKNGVARPVLNVVQDYGKSQILKKNHFPTFRYN